MPGWAFTQMREGARGVVSNLYAYATQDGAARVARRSDDGPSCALRESRAEHQQK